MPFNCVEKLSGRNQKRMQNLKNPLHIIKSRKVRHVFLKGPSFFQGGEIRKTPIPLDLLGIDHVDEDRAADS